MLTLPIVDLASARSFANVTHAAQINPLLAKFVQSRSDKGGAKGEVNSVSPFHERLWAFEGAEDEEEEEEEEESDEE